MGELLITRQTPKNTIRKNRYLNNHNGFFCISGREKLTFKHFNKSHKLSMALKYGLNAYSLNVSNEQKAWK